MRIMKRGITLFLSILFLAINHSNGDLALRQPLPQAGLGGNELYLEDGKIVNGQIKEVSSYFPSESNDLEETKTIEEDVQQNKEDIVDLRITDAHHDSLISQALNNNNILNMTFEQKLDLLIKSIQDRDEFLDQTRPPIGSIIAWLPAYSSDKKIPDGWQRCDGSLIKHGALRGQATPDLNTAGRFLRGSADAAAGSVQDDAVQDHTHIDEGHSHADAGHTHSDSGHEHIMDSSGDGVSFPPFIGADEAHAAERLCSSSYHEKCGGYYFRKDSVWATAKNKAHLSTNKANIQGSSSGLSGMGSGRVAQETRPKNMNVVYIMRIM